MPQPDLISQLKGVVGRKQVLTKDRKTAYYRSGFRSGFGGAKAVVFPGSLLEQWEVLKICVEANCAIILQATINIVRLSHIDRHIIKLPHCRGVAFIP